MWLPIIYMHMYLLTHSHILFLNGEKEIFWKCPLKRQLAIFQAIEYRSSTTVELIQTLFDSAYLFTWKKKYVHQMSFTIKENMYFWPQSNRSLRVEAIVTKWKEEKSCHKFKLNEALQIEEKKLEKVLGVDCKVFEWNW